MSKIIFTEGSEPDTPPSGKLALFVLPDKSIWMKTDAGAVIQLAAMIHAFSIISVQGGIVAEPTTDATLRKITAFITDGLSENMTPDATTANDITADVAGTYVIFSQVSFLGTDSKEYHIELFKNGTGTGFEGHRKLGTGGDIDSASCFGIVSLAIDDTIDVRHYSSDGGVLFTVDDAQLIAVRIG